MSLKYKKLTFFLTLGIMGLGMATFSFTAGPEDNTSKTTGSYHTQVEHNASDISDIAGDKTVAAITNTPIPTLSPEPEITKAVDEVDLSEVILEKDMYPDINQLIESYLAAKLDSTSTYEGIVTSPHLIDAIKAASDSEVIKKHHNIICYTKKGIHEISFIVYAYYDVELLMIPTFVPSFDEFCLAYNKEGKLVIYNDTPSKETMEYIDMNRSRQDVQELLEEINQKFMNAVENDSSLKEFFEKISSE